MKTPDSPLETVHHDEGVVTTRSKSGMLVQLPAPHSEEHQLQVIAVLWGLWIAARNEVFGKKINWIVSVPDQKELTLPLITILSMIDSELHRVGHTHLVVGGPCARSLAFGRT